MNYQLLEVLQQNKLRNTAARQLVFTVLKQHAALTIHELSKKTSPAIDPASMYRTLTTFRELGILHDVVIGGKRKVELTDQFSPHHHHIACISCGKIVVLHDESLEQHIEALAKDHGFEHQSHSFEISGICSECAAKQPTI